MYELEIPTLIEQTKPKSLNRDGRYIRENARRAYRAYIGDSLSRQAHARKRFRELFNNYKNNWVNETMFSSDPYEITSNRNYIEIIGLGRAVLPFILEDLQNTYNHWFVALQEITGENPINQQIAGNIAEMTKAWLSWAKENHIYNYEP
jgi:hypothetical protein